MDPHWPINNVKTQLNFEACTVNLVKSNKIGGSWGDLDVPIVLDYVVVLQVLHI
jgi:hypothetical protein